MSEANVRFRLDHVGVAVNDLTVARDAWEDVFGTPTSPPEQISGEQVELSFLETQNARVELLQSTSSDGAIAKFLDRRPPGVHHLSFSVEGIQLDAWFAELVGRGVRLIGDGPTEGSDGTRVFFVHPSVVGGVLIEFAQKPLPGQKSGSKSPQSQRESDP